MSWDTDAGPVEDRAHGGVLVRPRPRIDPEGLARARAKVEAAKARHRARRAVDRVPASLRDLLDPPDHRAARTSRWITDATSCWPRCETGASILLHDRATRAMRLVGLTRDRLKDCAECRARRWEQRQGRWLRHLWVENDDLWVARGELVGLPLPTRPDRLWVGWGISPASAARIRETRNAREAARREAIDYFVVAFEDGRVFIVAAEDLSPRERLLTPCVPERAWHLLGAAYTSDNVRRHKGRSMSEAWEVPPWFERGPTAARGRLKRAVRAAGFGDWTVPDGVEWATVVEAVSSALEDEPKVAHARHNV